MEIINYDDLKQTAYLARLEASKVTQELSQTLDLINAAFIPKLAENLPVSGELSSEEAMKACIDSLTALAKAQLDISIILEKIRLIQHSEGMLTQIPAGVLDESLNS